MLTGEKPDQIGDDGRVDQNQQKLPPGGVVVGFQHLQGQKGGGQDERDVLCPALFQNQARSLQKIQGSVGKGEDAELPQAMIVDQGEIAQQCIDEDIAGLKAQRINQAHSQVVQIAMEQPEQPKAERNKEHALAELEYADQDQDARTMQGQIPGSKSIKT